MSILIITYSEYREDTVLVLIKLNRVLNLVNHKIVLNRQVFKKFILIFSVKRSNSYFKISKETIS